MQESFTKKCKPRLRKVATNFFLSRITAYFTCVYHIPLFHSTLCLTLLYKTEYVYTECPWT